MIKKRGCANNGHRFINLSKHKFIPICNNKILLKVREKYKILYFFSKNRL